MNEEPSQRKLVTIVNAPRLGNDKEWIKGLWKEHFSDAEWIETKNWSEAKNMSSCFIGMTQGDPLYLQSIGGDGSHNAIANAYLERGKNNNNNFSNNNIDVILGFVPAGSGNDISRALGFHTIKKLRGKKDNTIEKYLMPFKEAQNSEVNNIINMDAGMITLFDDENNREKCNHFFVNCFGLGYFADVNKRVSENNDDNDKRYMATLLDLQKEHKRNGVFSLNNFYSTTNKVSAVNNYQGHAFEVVNSKDFGGKVRINPQGNITDGSMEAFVVKSAKRRNILRNLIEVKLNSYLHLIDQNIIYKKGIKEIGSGLSSPQTLQADGEVLEANNNIYKQVNVRVLPQALPVVTNYKRA